MNKHRLVITSLAIVAVSCCGVFAEQLGEYFREDQNIGQVLAGAGGSSVSAMASALPYAYYPSKNQMEVAVALSAELLKKACVSPGKVKVRILGVQSGKPLATGEVPLDKEYRGQAVFSIPDLPDGEYAVEYVVGNFTQRSPKTFKRIHFPFEKTAYGETHKVCPPFTPIKVRGNTVSVVDRSYTVNAQGVFDSVVSQGRELMAAPMRLVGETSDGKPLVWHTGWFTDGVKGKATYPDEAVFDCETQSQGCKLKSRITIQEDGCAKVSMTFLPIPTTNNQQPQTISNLRLEIPLKDSEAPLFHYIADNGMRFNYAGKTPRGGKIEWYSQKWDGWVPLRWRVVQGSPDDGIIWTSNDTRQHPNDQAADHRPVVPYIWLGAEERGLAFFMENEKGFVTDYRTPVQKVIRSGDQVIIRVEIVQQPVTLAEPRTITFGLMASPSKPMEKSFRTRSIASGVGPVICWGGWQCASKYPDNHDWSIVDKIQEIRRRGTMTPADESWFSAKNAEVKSRWPDRLIQNDPKAKDWLSQTVFFAKRAVEQGRVASGVYFEEHATDPRLPEWEVFQDEWASAEFNRFRDKPANWGVFSASYHDFVLYMANEWMKRGVSLYFDNTNPKRCYNERFGPAFRTPDGALVYGISIFGQRDYYRRIFKLLNQWNARGVEYPIDFTLHITNTQTLPLNTWATATLDLEQRSHTEDPAKVPAEVVVVKKDGTTNTKPDGYQLPWPPEYTRAVTFGRQVGAIPIGLDFVSGHNRHAADQYTPEMMLRDWAMCRIHDIRGCPMFPKSAVLARQFDKVYSDFIGIEPGKVEYHNYWTEKLFVQVSDDRVKWMALSRTVKSEATEGLLLLQSYSRTEAITVDVLFPEAAAFKDIATGEVIPVERGRAKIVMPANFSTRMFQVSRVAVGSISL
jgi:hypothetical protein